MSIKEILKWEFKMPKIISDEELFPRIQKRAYEFYEARGYQSDRDMDDWLRAEREVKRELGLL